MISNRANAFAQVSLYSLTLFGITTDNDLPRVVQEHCACHVIHPSTKTNICAIDFEQIKHVNCMISTMKSQERVNDFPQVVHEYRSIIFSRGVFGFRSL